VALTASATKHPPLDLVPKLTCATILAPDERGVKWSTGFCSSDGDRSGGEPRIRPVPRDRVDAMECDADASRFDGKRHEYEQDESLADVSCEPGKVHRVPSMYTSVPRCEGIARLHTCQSGSQRHRHARLGTVSGRNSVRRVPNMRRDLFQWCPHSPQDCSSGRGRSCSDL